MPKQPQNRPPLPPDLGNLATDLAPLRAIGEINDRRMEVEKQNQRRCVCGNRIRHDGVLVFGIYIGPIPVELTGGIPIPDGNIHITAWFCSRECGEYKETVEGGIVWDGSLTLKLPKIRVSGVQAILPIDWLDEHDHPSH